MINTEKVRTNSEEIRKNLIKVEQSEFHKLHDINMYKMDRKETKQILNETKELLDNILNEYE